MQRSTALIPGSILVAALALLPGPAAGQTSNDPQDPGTPTTQGTQDQGMQNQGTPQARGTQTQGTQGQGMEGQGAQAAQGGMAQGPASADPQALELVNRLIETMGGQSNFDRARYFRFTFAGRRRHYWDKWTGQHRLEGQNAQGQSFVVLSNVNTRQGTAYLNGQQVEGAAVQEYVNGAHAAWVNDTYWLLAPYKLKDPGVNLKHEGSEQLDGVNYDKLAVTFQQGTGLTSGDRYWFYISKNSGLVERWAYLLQGQPENTQPTHWLWQNWQQIGNVVLSPVRVQVGGQGPESRIEFTDLAVTESMPETVFTSPEAPAGAQ